MEDQALNYTQKQYMLRKGFLPYEVKAFADAKTPNGKQQNLDFHSKPFQSMISERERYIHKLAMKGFTPMQSRQRIEMLYKAKRGKASPWDFLKIEYRPQKKVTDTVWATMLKAKQRIARTLGSGYSKPIRKDTRPRYTPKVMELPPLPE